MDNPEWSDYEIKHSIESIDVARFGAGGDLISGLGQRSALASPVFGIASEQFFEDDLIVSPEEMAIRAAEDDDCETPANSCSETVCGGLRRCKRARDKCRMNNVKPECPTGCAPRWRPTGFDTFQNAEGQRCCTVSGNWVCKKLRRIG